MRVSGCRVRLMRREGGIETDLNDSLVQPDALGDALALDQVGVAAIAEAVPHHADLRRRKMGAVSLRLMSQPLLRSASDAHAAATCQTTSTL